MYGWQYEAGESVFAVFVPKRDPAAPKRRYRSLSENLDAYIATATSFRAEDAAAATGHMKNSVNRRLKDLVNDGVLSRVTVQRPGGGNPAYLYQVTGRARHG